MKNFLSLCLMVGSIVAASLGENKTQVEVGGIALVLTKKGLDYAAVALVDFLEEKIKGARIDDIAGTTETIIAYIDYWFKDTIITSFKKPSATVKLNPFQGVTLTLSGAGLSATSNWKYFYRSGAIKFGDQGSFEALAEGISMSVSVFIEKSERGSPNVTITDCQCSIANLRIDLNSRANWFYNILLKIQENKIRDYFQHLFCEKARNAIDVMTSKHLDTLNMQAQFNDVLSLNYGLVADPILRGDIISFRFVGRFAGDDVEERAPVPKLPKSHMIGATVSDVTLNSAFRVLHKTKQLHHSFNLTDDILVRVVFRLLDGVGVSFKGTGLAVSVRPSAPPLVSIKPGNISISGEIEGSSIVQHANGSNSTALTVKVTILTQLEARISNNRIFGEVKDFKPILTYLSVSDANAGVLKSSITEVTMILRPLLNDFLAKGLSMSVIHGVQFQDPIIQSHDRYITVATNVAYVG